MKILNIAFLALCVSNLFMNAHAERKPTKAELAAQAAAQARKDSLDNIMNMAEQGNPAAINEVGNWYYTGQNVEAADYKKAAQWWLKAAKAGNVYALGNLGLCYQMGHGVEKDSVRSQELYLKAIKDGNTALIDKHTKLAENANVFSNVLMAKCYKEGNGVTKNLQKAAQYFETAAKLGSVESMQEGGMCYMNSRQESKAFPLFKLGAEKKNIVCTYWTGKMLIDGNGVTKDATQGVSYLLNAAEGGFANAQYQLGNCYMEGNGVAQDAGEAVSWYKKAVSNGVIGAKWQLAECYRTGNGSNMNFDEAIGLYAEAVANGYTKSFKKLLEEETVKTSVFYSYLQGLKQMEIAQDYVAAAKTFKNIEKVKHVEGAVMGAVLLGTKNNPKSNVKKAFKMLEKQNGLSAYADYYLATFYENGIGIEKDEDKAITLYKKSAEKGCSWAMCLLGDMYYEGNYVQKDVFQAVKYYLHANETGQLSEKSASNLSNCYIEGLGGLRKDSSKAKDILKNVKKDVRHNLLSLF